MGFVAVLAVGFTLFVRTHREDRTQRQALDAIRRDGLVWYDWERRAGKPTNNASPWRTKNCVRRHLGRDYFSNVVYVLLYESGSDDQLVNVGKLRRLEELDLYRSQITDRGLIHLVGLKSLIVGWCT
jgi:hypothetical protein